MDHDKFDLESELRAGRSKPRAQFASALAGEVRGATGRARQSRIGLTLALSGLVVVAVVSFGGIGYASTNKPAAVKHSATSAATAQYGNFTPKTKTLTPKAKPAPKARAQVAAQTKTKQAPKPTAQLPFTGLALWIPLAVGLVLIALGLVLRTRGRRHGPAAH
jgi:hypothetical protein